MKESEALLVLITTPNDEVSTTISTAVVEKRLAACVNVIKDIRSVFHWKGKVDDEAEQLLLLKTTATRYPALEEEVRRIHPYECPEVIGFPITVGSADYLSWIAKEASPPTKEQ